MNSLDPSHQASSQGLEPEDAEGRPSYQDLTIRRRQLRRRVWERFEFAFFLGLMMTVIVLGITVMASHLLGGQRMSANNYLDEGRDELMVINVEPESVKAPPVDEDEDVFAVDTSWIAEDTEALQTNPYVTAVTQNPYTYDYEDLDLETVGPRVLHQVHYRQRMKLKLALSPPNRWVRFDQEAAEGMSRRSIDSPLSSGVFIQSD